jgi:hypothetical protein
MRAKALSRHVTVLVLICLSTLAAPGCEKVKKLFIKPAPEGMTRRSYTIPLNGYEDTVDIKASLPEVMRYVSDPAHFVVKIGDSPARLWEGDRPELGTSFPASTRFFGLEFKGRAIVVKSEERRIWMVLDNPYAFLAVRFNLDPIKSGTRLSFKGDYELPGEGEAMGKAVDFKLIADRVIRNFDLTLARLQAKFDPSLDPEKLVAKGPRGEGYQTLLQVYETEVWVDAPPAKVEKWVIAPERMPVLFPELQSDPEKIIEYNRSAVGSVTYPDCSAPGWTASP